MLTEEEFTKGMRILGSAYPDYECTPKTVDVYRDRLRDHLRLQEWEAAVNRHIDTCKWFPKVSEILKAVQDFLPTPIDVWNRLNAAAEMGQKPEMDEATQKALLVLGGGERFQYTPFAAGADRPMFMVILHRWPG